MYHSCFKCTKEYPNIPIETFKGTYTTMSKELNEDCFYIISLNNMCPCINELDAINEVYDELSKEMDFKVLAISTDDARTKEELNLLNGKAWKFDVLLDENHDLKSIKYFWITLTQ